MTLAEPAERTSALGTGVAVPSRRLFTVDDYYAMARAGILREDDRVELIEGEIVVMSPSGSRHAGCVNRLVHLLVEAARDGAVVAAQNPLRLDDLTEPEPDVAVLAWRADHYSGRHPEARDVYLLVEVSESSLAFDREVKLPLYARHGIPEVWIVDVLAERVEVHRSSGPTGYAESWTCAGDDRLTVPGLEVVVTAEEVIPGS